MEVLQKRTNKVEAFYLPEIERFPFYFQGETNACGTTSLAMILTYLGVPTKTGVIDRAIRRMDTFTSPVDLLMFARDQGIRAVSCNETSVEELKRFLESGIAIQALIRVAGFLHLHYICITGIEADYVLYHDPCVAQPVEQKMHLPEFESRWGTIAGGFRNYVNLYASGEIALPPPRDQRIEASLSLVEGITNASNGFHRIVHPENAAAFSHGLLQFPAGIGQTSAGLIACLFSLTGQSIYEAIDGVKIVQNIIQPLAGLTDTIGAVIGDLALGTGEATDNAGQALENLLNRNFVGFRRKIRQAIFRIAHGFLNAFMDLFSGFIDATFDFFK